MSRASHSGSGSSSDCIFDQLEHEGIPGSVDHVGLPCDVVDSGCDDLEPGTQGLSRISEVDDVYGTKVVKSDCPLGGTNIFRSWGKARYCLIHGT